MSKNQQPKPCPFCGWGTIIDGGLLFGHACECNSCHAKTKTYKTWEEAVKAWNRRIVGQTNNAYQEEKEIIRLNEIISSMETQIKIIKLMTEECIKTETGKQSSQRKFDSILDFASYMKGLSQALLSSLTYYEKNITQKTVEDMIDRYKVSE